MGRLGKVYVNGILGMGEVRGGWIGRKDRINMLRSFVEEFQFMVGYIQDLKVFLFLEWVLDYFFYSSFIVYFLDIFVILFYMMYDDLFIGFIIIKLYFYKNYFMKEF